MAHAKRKMENCDAAQKTHLTQLCPLQQDLDRCVSQLNSSKQVINIKTIDMWNMILSSYLHTAATSWYTWCCIWKKKNLC